MSLAVHARAEVIRNYDWTLNYNFTVIDGGPKQREGVRQCSVLHYHGSLLSTHYERALPFLDALPNDVFALIREHAPITPDDRPGMRILNRLLRSHRARRYGAYERSCASY